MSMKILEMQDNGELAKMKHKWFVAVIRFFALLLFENIMLANQHLAAVS